MFDQHPSKNVLEFATFNAAVDAFFSVIESQIADQKAKNQEALAQRKLQAIKDEHFARLKGLEEAQETDETMAQVLSVNIDPVNEAIVVLQNAIARGMDWKEINDLVVEEQKQGNSIARRISDLKLFANKATLKLPSADGPLVNVDIDLDLLAHGNIKVYYEKKRLAQIKYKKTEQAAEKAFKSAERKIRKDLAEIKVANAVQKIRKPLWFEKFAWFVTTDNYLAIAGRDSQQNELLVKRYLKAGECKVLSQVQITLVARSNNSAFVQQAMRTCMQISMEHRQ